MFNKGKSNQEKSKEIRWERKFRLFPGSGCRTDSLFVYRKEKEKELE